MSVEVDLSQKLCADDLPAEIRGAKNIRLVRLAKGETPGSRYVIDIRETPVDYAVCSFNKERKKWREANYRVLLEKVN